MDNFPQVTRPRIVVPRRRSELLTRPRLLKSLMDHLDNRLVIISAPAGYGKTSLLVDFVHQLEWPACWYAIDELDRDPLRFIAHFISSIQVRFPQFGRTTLGILGAIHLAMVLIWKEQARENVVMATHATALALVAKASGLR